MTGRRARVVASIGVLGVLATVASIVTGSASSLTVSPEKLTVRPSTAASIPAGTPGLNLAVSPNPVTVGSATTATATLGSPVGAEPYGDVTFSRYASAGCTGTSLESAGPFALTGDPVTASTSHTPSAAGSFWWQASYSGNANNDPSLSSCIAVTVSSAGPSITCGLVLTAPANATAGTGFNVTLTAQRPNAGNTACETDPTYAGEKTITWSGGSTSPAPTSKAPDQPASAVTFTTGVASEVTGWVLYAEGSSSITASDGAQSDAADVAVAEGLPALQFTATTVKGVAVTCSPTTAIDVQGNKDVLTTKVQVVPTDSWSNPVTLASTGTINVTVALNAIGTASFNTPTGASLTIVRPAGTTGGTFSAERKDGGKFTGGTMTATATDYATASCALFH